jgi:hypothetical protein
MKKYTRTIEVEAVQFNGKNAKEIIEWAGEENIEKSKIVKSFLIITHYDDLSIEYVSNGDWVIKDGGTFKVLDPDAFDILYKEKK